MNFLVTDDHPLVRRGVREVLQESFANARIFEAHSSAETTRLLNAEQIDFLILDLSLPDRHGLDCIDEIVRRAPSPPVLVLSMHAEERFAIRALELGARGYLVKDHAPNELVNAIRRILGGRRYIGAEVAEALAGRALGSTERAPHTALSPRELTVMLEIARGRMPADIARTLLISAKTVSTYRSRILQKMGLGSTAELARYCLTHGLIH